MPKRIPFAKFHGLGNDFLVVGGDGLPRPISKFARAILDRHTGVGADGLLVLTPARAENHDARLGVFNADGSEAEMSGNGIRCAGAFLSQLSPARRTFLIETMAGVKTLEKVKEENGRWLFRVSMGAPILDPAKIPFKAGTSAVPVKGYPFRTERGVVPVTVTSMGNPHCSIFVEDFVETASRPAAADRAPGVNTAPLGQKAESVAGGTPRCPFVRLRDFEAWESLGRKIETSPLFPNRTNVEFVKVISRREIAVRFWERGVGHTMSSGTGSCGAAVASILNDLTGRQIRVQTQAGSLQVAWPENGEVVLTGPVEEIARGTYNH
jgi:diaminopimelate epimerase